MQRRFEDALDRRPSSERRLRARPSARAARLDLTRIAVPRECRQRLPAARPSNRSTDAGELSQLTDSGDADLASRAVGGGAHAPHERDGQFVKEREFSIWMTTTNPSGFATCDAILAQVLGTRHAD